MSARTIPTLASIDHIHIYVPDRAAAERWYAETLGLRRVPELAFWADGGPLTIANEEGSVHLALFERAAKSPGGTVAFKVDADAFLQWRRHLSDVFQRSLDAVDHDVSFSLYFADPDGNPFEITSYDYARIKAQLQIERAGA